MTERGTPIVQPCAHPGCCGTDGFGFGPPLVPKQVWYCSAAHIPDHLKQAERKAVEIVVEKVAPAAGKIQGRLL